ncbi:hypothetical protein ABW55_14345 [Acinetobacter sp. C15]|uniref:hypothetical protein n=1 Tax=unclassified Acinetobacter TaxID=196816 RepID=UPI0006609AD7|nr:MULTISPECIES: hypothetical protein [unclassified Acinetobacter]KOR12702.1 hypothetical protein ABW55_14345 [Acinetobacter sp. C15]
MKIIQKLADLVVLDDVTPLHSLIKLSISSIIQSLEQQYETAYEATLYGWFLVCESVNDLTDPLAELSFSVCEKINNGEVEFVEQQADWYEVYITINDTEGVLVYVPKYLLSANQLSTLCAISNNF